MESPAEEFRTLQQDLTEELDPVRFAPLFADRHPLDSDGVSFQVDWATYETHLHDLVAQHALRAANILGPLGQLHPAAVTNSGSASTASAGRAPRGDGRVVTRPTQSMVDADVTKSVVPLISGDTPRFHTLPVSMPVKQPTKKLPDRPGAASGVHDEWLPTKKSERTNLCFPS